jgi:hypothetical protein
MLVQGYLRLLAREYVSKMLSHTVGTRVCQYNFISDCWHESMSIQCYLRLLAREYVSTMLSHTVGTRICQYNVSPTVGTRVCQYNVISECWHESMSVQCYLILSAQYYVNTMLSQTSVSLEVNSSAESDRAQIPWVMKRNTVTIFRAEASCSV